MFLVLSGVIIEAAETVNAVYVYGGAAGLLGAITFVVVNYFRAK